MELLKAILGALFGAIVSGITAAIGQKRADATQRQAGQLEQQTADQQATIEAQKRMDQAGAQPHDTQGDMKKGGF